MNNQLILKTLKGVLKIQSQSIMGVCNGLSGTYVSAVRLLLKCKGKIVVTGIGKSGLIAQKIASTMSSTGTPAIYLHPTEAMHGDLGVVNKNDVILAVGKSGESQEILALLPFFRKIGVKIISITANKNSNLARASHIVLHTPFKREACPLGLAPTTSSTVALAVGDALAIALMRCRGFGSEHFALYHPGGLLGKRLLLKVSDVMRRGRRNPIVSITASIENLLEEISAKWTGAASIVGKNKKFMGLVTDFDIRKALMRGRSVLELSIRDLMNPRPTTIYEDEMAVRAAEIMELREKPLTVLPVLDRKKRAVGMIHTHDLINLGLIQEPSS